MNRAPNNRLTYRFDGKGNQVSKPEDKLEHKLDHKLDHKLEQKSEYKPEYKLRHKPESRIEPKSKFNPEPASEPKPESKPESKQGDKLQAQTDDKKPFQPGSGNVIPLYPTTVANGIDEVRPWEYQAHDDLMELEKLIRDTEGTSPRQESAGADRMDYELAYEGPQREAEGYSLRSTEEQADSEHYSRLHETVNTESSYRRSGNGPSWFNVFLSVAGALVTGALFGYLILNLFTGGIIWPGSSENAAVEGGPGQGVSLDDIVSLPLTEAESGDDRGGQGDTTANSPESKPVSTVALDGQFQYTLLQYGVFSSAGSRDAALQQLADQGLPGAAMASDGKYLVYAGLAASPSEAATLTSVLPGLQVYKKDLSLRPEELAFQGDAETAVLFFEETNALVSTWSTLVIAQLEQPSLSKIGTAAMETWKQRYEAWGKLAEQMNEGVTDQAGRTYLTRMTEAIDACAEAMLAYDQAISKTSLWEAQSAMLQNVLAQKEWFETTSAL